MSHSVFLASYHFAFVSFLPPVFFITLHAMRRRCCIFNCCLNNIFSVAVAGATKKQMIAILEDARRKHSPNPFLPRALYVSEHHVYVLTLHDIIRFPPRAQDEIIIFRYENKHFSRSYEFFVYWAFGVRKERRPGRLLELEGF